jgi:hypothetical protein
VFSLGAKTLAIDPTTCSLWELTGGAAACLAVRQPADSGPAPQPSGETVPRPFSPAAAGLGACRVAGFFAPPPAPSPSAAEAPCAATTVLNQVNLTPELLRRWKTCSPAERLTLSLVGPEDAHDAMRWTLGDAGLTRAWCVRWTLPGLTDASVSQGARCLSAPSRPSVKPNRKGGAMECRLCEKG